MIKHLEFSNPVFNDGLNVTIRRGVKWATEYGLVRLCGVGIKPPKIMGQVVKTMAMRFCDIPKNILEYEHDPDCQEYEGLSHTMGEIYPGFDTSEIVTVIFFQVEQLDR